MLAMWNSGVQSPTARDSTFHTAKAAHSSIRSADSGAGCRSGQDVKDKFATGRLKSWGRYMEGNRRLALAPIQAAFWQDASFTATAYAARKLSRCEQARCGRRVEYHRHTATATPRASEPFREASQREIPASRNHQGFDVQFSPKAAFPSVF